MPRNRAWVVALIGLLLATHLLTSSAAASPKLTFTDPVGDVVVPNPIQPTGEGMDILQVSIEVVEIAPENYPHLMFTWKLAGPPPPHLSIYSMRGLSETCGEFRVDVFMGTAADTVWASALNEPSLSNTFAIDCGREDPAHVDLHTELDGSVLKAWASLRDLPPAARSGTLKGLGTYSAICDPVIGFVHLGYYQTSDEARTSERFVY